MIAKLNSSITLTATQRLALALFLKHIEENGAPSALVPTHLFIVVDDLVDAFNAIDSGDRDPSDYLPDGE